MTQQQYDTYVELVNLVNNGYQLTQQQQQALNQLDNLYKQSQQQQPQQYNQQQYVQQPQQYVQQPQQYNQQQYVQQSPQQPRQQYNQYSGQQPQQNSSMYVNRTIPQGRPFSQHSNVNNSVTPAHGENHHSRYGTENLDEPIKPVNTNVNAPIKNEVRASVEQVPIVEAIAVDGNEFQPLMTPDLKCIKRVRGGFYTYEAINKEESEMDKDIHHMIYDPVSLITSENKGDFEEAKFNMHPDIIRVPSIRDAVNDMIVTIGEDNKNIEFNAGQYMVCEGFAISKTSTEETELQLAKLILKSDDIEDLAKLIKFKIEKSDTFTSSAYRDINGTLTSYINKHIESTTGRITDMSSFVYDITELFEYIEEKFKSPTVKNIMNNSILDVYNKIKSNATDVMDYMDKDNEENVNIGLTYMSDRITLVRSTSENLEYELTELTKNNIRYVKNDLTPILYDLINTIMKTTSNTIILVDKKNSKYRIMKTKLSVDYNIEMI